MKTFVIDRYVRNLKNARGITLQELSRILGYSSQTSLTRLMKETANRSSLQKFADRLRGCPQLALTQVEKNQLDDLIELYDIGGEDFEVMLMLRQILRGERPQVSRDFRLVYPDGRTNSFLGHFAGVRIRRMLLLNSELAPIYQDLASLLEQGDFVLEHWLYARSGAMRMVHMLHIAMPLIYSQRYIARTFSYNDQEQVIPRGLITSDMLICEYETEAGQVQNEIIIFNELNRGQLQPVSAGIDCVMRFLPDVRRMNDVRRRISNIDLLQYNAFCAELERNRSVCRIKPDLGIEQIPLDILRRAIHDQAPIEILQEMGPLVEAFRERQQNVCEKDAPQYHILKRGAMWRFVHSGYTSDHLWCCRPYTIQERGAILRFLRDKLMTLPGFHLYFLKDDDALCDDEIILYEDCGLSILKSGTDYDMSREHAEIMITQPELLKAFRRFFLESTLRYRVDTEEAAAAEIERMIAFCEAEVNGN